MSYFSLSGINQAMSTSSSYVDLGRSKSKTVTPPVTPPVTVFEQQNPPEVKKAAARVQTGLWTGFTSIFSFLFSDIKTTLTNLLLLFFGWQYFGGSISLPWPLRTSPPGVRLGRDFRAPLNNSMAEGWEALASDLEAKKSISDADAHLKQVFHDSRNKVFLEKCASEFSAILPEGKDFADDLSRARYIKLSRDFAHGLRGGH